MKSLLFRTSLLSFVYIIWFLYPLFAHAGLEIIPVNQDQISSSTPPLTIVVTLCSEAYIKYRARILSGPGGLVIIPVNQDVADLREYLEGLCDDVIPSGYKYVKDIDTIEATYGVTSPIFTLRRVEATIINPPSDSVPPTKAEVPTSQPTSLVPSGLGGDYNPDGYGSCEVVSTVNNVITFLIKMTGVLTVIVFLYAGFLMVSSRGDAAMISQAKGLFANVLIGFVILLTAFLIVNTILGILVGGAKGGFTWQQIECQYANKYAPAEKFGIENKTGQGLSIPEVDTIVATYDPSLVASSAGVCGGGLVEKIWGPLANPARCIITEESACGSVVISRSDIGADRNPFSFGVMQINTTVHEVKGCESLGIRNMRCLDAWSGTDYGARVTNAPLYNACRKALLNPECNMINGKRIYKEAGRRWRPWSTARLCGLR